MESLSNDRGPRRLIQAVKDLSLARHIDQVDSIVRTAARELTGAEDAACHADQITIELLQALASMTIENLRVHQQLEAANHELDAFSHSVSHDLRAPLRRINGFAQLLQEQAGAGLDDESRHFLSRITGSVEQMTGLIEGLLAFARLGRAALNLQPVRLSDIVREAQRETMTEAGDRQIDWHLDVPDVVQADPTLLRHAVVNLLSNAVKYTRGRIPAQIEVGVRANSANHEVAIFVRDNGAGFDPQYADKLFGVFQRLHSNDEFEGTGIGLANVRRIITRHGGRTWAEGAVNQGATFWFTLPTPQPTSLS